MAVQRVKELRRRRQRRKKALKARSREERVAKAKAEGRSGVAKATPAARKKA